jgi:hypothetical protein
MESGFKRLFLRKRSKSKPLVISEPLKDTFRQTAGYDGFAAGPPPTIGARPIKPSELKGKRKSFSHLRTKSVGVQEFRQLVHTDSVPRPRTAPGTQAPSTNHSELRQPNRASQDETRLPPNALQAPPEVPDLPKGLAERGGPKYFDLLQAAVSPLRAHPPAVFATPPFDFYNESIADRNSLYGKPSRLSVNEEVVEIASMQGDNNAAPTQTMDIQRASFDAMRASRNARFSASRSAGEGSGVNTPRSSAAEANDNATQSLPENVVKQDWSGSDWNGVQDTVLPQTPSEGRRMKRRSVRKTDVSSQLFPILQEKSSPIAAPVDNIPLLGSTKPLSGRKTSKTVPTAHTRENVSNARRTESPAILTLYPFEYELNQSAAADSMAIAAASHTPSKIHGCSASTDQTSSPRPDIAHDYVPPRISSDRSARKREKDKRHSRELVATAGRSNPEVVRVTNGASRMKTSSSRRMDLWAVDHGVKSDEDDDNGYDVGIEEAVTHQADPVQILRAAVVSANGYVYRGGDNVVLGKVLHHRPSRGLSQIEDDGSRLILPDATSPTGSEDQNGTSASPKAPSPTVFTASKSLIQHTLGGNGERPTASIPWRSPPDLDAAAASSLKVPPQATPEARTSLPKSEHAQEALASEVDLQGVQPETTQLPQLTSATTDPASSAVVQPYEDVARTNGYDRFMSSSPAIVTRDFAQPLTPPRVRPPEAIEKFQPRMRDGITTPIGSRHKNSTLGAYIHIRQQEFELESSDLDRSIAIKKAAAAKALLKLQQVMAMPTWEEEPNIGHPRAPMRLPSHWRDLSIEDGGPIAPSAIFRKVKIPVLTPPLSRHSTFSRREGHEAQHSPKNLMSKTAGEPLATSLQAAFNEALINEARKEDIASSGANLEFHERPWLEQRGRSDTTVPHTKGSHSRMGSAVSAASGTSAYSLPYHMVPARGSSMRDSVSSGGDFGDSPNFHVGESGWH